MPTPNTTIQVTATCTDQAGVLVSTCSAVRVTLTFPDLTIQTLTLASGVTNLGAGQYQVVYNTKGVGTVVEDWQFTAIDGVTVAEVRNHTAVEY